MDNTLSNNSVMNSVQQKTPTKRSKNNKKRNNNNSSNNKHIKVVYISNPMKVKTSASEFRALVQELTGQDSELPPDPSKYQGFGSSDGDGGSSGGESENHQKVVDYDDNCALKIDGDDEDNYYNNDPVVVLPPPLPPPVDPDSNTNNCHKGQFDFGVGGRGGGGGCSMESFEAFDEDDFTPQMIENISSSFFPSSVLYESHPQVDQVVMQCNYVHP